jgi:glycosyltransferase involved in cell wall biosynthesis
MRIAFIDPLKLMGGQERFCISLAEEYFKKGHEVFFITNNRSSLIEELQQKLPSSSVIKINFGSRFSVLSVWLIRCFLLENNIEIALFNGDRSGVFGKMVALLGGGKFKSVHCMHLLIEDITQNYKFFKRGIYNYISRIGLFYYDLIIPVNPSFVPILLTHGLKKTKIHSIPNGMPYLKPTREAKEVKQEIGIGKSDLSIGFIGRLDAQKGISYLIDAMLLILNKTPNVKLIILGEGDLEDDLKNQVKRLGIQKSVIFGGFKVDINNYFQIFDVVVFPSLYEGFPLAVIEAMSHGCGIVASDISGNSLALQHRVNALLFPSKDYKQLADKVNCLLSSGELRTDISIKAHENYLSYFTWEIMVRNYIETLDNLIDRN